MSQISKIFRSVADMWSLIVGLRITGKAFCQSQVTVHYPRDVVDDETNTSYRGPIKLRPHPRNEKKSKCTACMICVTACPSQCIEVVKAPAPILSAEQEAAFKAAEERGEEVDRPSAPREAVLWINDFSLCSLCGLCIEACPTNCLEFSHELYIAVGGRKDLFHDLLAPFPETLSREPVAYDGPLPTPSAVQTEGKET